MTGIDDLCITSDKASGNEDDEEASDNIEFNAGLHSLCTQQKT